MKLSEKDKNELRKKIEKKLADVPEGKRIHIDKKLLEYLLFAEVINYIGGNYTTTAKIIKWSGKHLQKIDLSEVSFDNVMWDHNRKHIDRFGNIQLYYESPYQVDLSYTNAKIDFKKSFDALNFYNDKANRAGVVINGFNLSHVDLSESNIHCVTDIENTDLSYTNAHFIFWLSLSEEDDILRISNSSLEGIDLSDKSLSIYHFCNNPDKYDTDLMEYIDTHLEGSYLICVLIENSNLSKTGLNISNNEIDKKILSDLGYESTFNDEIRANHLAGCYCNGKLIESRHTRSNRKRKLKKEYEELKKEYLNVLSNIDNQIKEQQVEIKEIESKTKKKIK